MFSTTAKALTLVVFALLLGAGVVAGLIGSRGEREPLVLTGVVTSVTAAGNDPSPKARLTRVDVRLDDGRDVFIASGATVLRGVDKGQRVKVAQRVTSWGQTWYALVEPKPQPQPGEPTPTPLAR